MAAPAGWFLAGLAPKDYEVAVVPSDRRNGLVAVLRAITEPKDFGTLMQEFVPDAFRGRRVRLSGWVRSEDVADWCGLWMRVDGPGKRILVIDNMWKRPIKGTTAWTRYEVVLNVAAEAEVLRFGISLHGRGAVWLDEVALAVVENDVPTTDLPQPTLAHEPRNLDFVQP